MSYTQLSKGYNSKGHHSKTQSAQDSLIYDHYQHTSVDIHSVYEIAVTIDKFHNIDLPRQGIYYLECSVYTPRSEFFDDIAVSLSTTAAGAVVTPLESIKQAVSQYEAVKPGIT